MSFGSTFGGRSDLANIGSNGGALSSIGVSFSVISHNEAIRYGANPARPGTPGGGGGGAIYNDGNTFTLDACGSTLTDNTANEEEDDQKVAFSPIGLIVEKLCQYILMPARNPGQGR